MGRKHALLAGSFSRQYGAYIHFGGFWVQQDQWHYNDERKKKRLGPIDRDEVANLIATDRIDRSTLVWNPAMPEWAKASTTDLAGLFADSPPPLPANAISRWAIYALALFPLWGLAIQAVACAAFSDRLGLSPPTMFEHRAWLLFFIAGNGVLGDLDERNLNKGGLKMRGAAIMAAIFVPIYLFASCTAMKRHGGRNAWLAFLPVIIWVLALAAAFVVTPMLFDPDAPLILRPDAWF